MSAEPRSLNAEPRSLGDYGEARYSRSLERGLAILECFTPEQPTLGVAELAEELGMGRSTTHRYVATLLALGYLEQGPARKYRLALRVTELGLTTLNSTSLREHAAPDLKELSQRIGYTVNLGILDGQDVLYVERAPSSRRGVGATDLGLGVGSRLPAHCTSIGKMLLAHLPDKEQREVISQMPLTKHSPNTIASRTALRSELQRVLDDGVAINDQELAPGLRAIAVAVRGDHGDTRAAINVVAHNSNTSVEELVDRLLPHLRTTADLISARLNFRRTLRRVS